MSYKILITVYKRGGDSLQTEVVEFDSYPKAEAAIRSVSGNTDWTYVYNVVRLYEEQ